MLSLEELNKNRDLVHRIDWELTPQEAFEAYQIKSIGAWKYRSLPETFYFMISLYQGEARLLLIKRNLKDSEEIAEISVPSDLLDACLKEQAGDSLAYGHYPIDTPIKEWLHRELGV